MGDGQSSTHSWSKPPWQSSSTGDVLRQLPDVLRKSLDSLGHRGDLRCEVTQLCGELDQFDGWSFGTPGHCFAVAQNVDTTVKSVDLLGELAQAHQTENGNVLKESHAVGGSRLGYPGLFNDRLDLVLGTDSLGHSRYRRPGSPWSARVQTTTMRYLRGRLVLVVHAPTPTLFAEAAPEQPGPRSRSRRVVSCPPVAIDEQRGRAEP